MHGASIILDSYCIVTAENVRSQKQLSSEDYNYYYNYMLDAVYTRMKAAIIISYPVTPMKVIHC